MLSMRCSAIQEATCLHQSKCEQCLRFLRAVRQDLGDMRTEMLGFEQLKKDVSEAILSTSLEYERCLNELKYQLEKVQDQLILSTQRQRAQQAKAVELLSQKDEQIDQLRSRVQHLVEQNQHIKQARRIREQADAKVRGEYVHEVEELNLRINDLLAIIHEKTERLESSELAKREATTAREMLFTDQNIPHRANYRNRRQPSVQRQPFSDMKKEWQQTNIKRAEFKQPSRTSAKKPSEPESESSLLTVFTGKHDTSVELSQHQSDSEILSRLQQFVSDLTASHRPQPELKQIDKTIQAKYAPKPDWCSTLRGRNSTRGSLLFGGK